MSNILGYLRPGINKQSIQYQLDQLKAAGVSKIYQEKHFEKKLKTPQLEKLMAEALEGDTVVIASLDRIAHDTKHLWEIVESLYAAGVIFKVVDSGIDTSTQQGEVMRKLLGTIVDFERQVMKERQAVGIAKAKKEGRYKGRKPTARAKTGEVMTLNHKGLTKQKIADQLGIGVASVYRILKANTEPKRSRRKIAMKPEKGPVDKQKRVERKPTRDVDAEQLSFF